jgi:hypothetical protein
LPAHPAPAFYVLSFDSSGNDCITIQVLKKLQNLKTLCGDGVSLALFFCCKLSAIVTTCSDANADFCTMGYSLPFDRDAATV